MYCCHVGMSVHRDVEVVLKVVYTEIIAREKLRENGHVVTLSQQNVVMALIQLLVHNHVVWNLTANTNAVVHVENALKVGFIDPALVLATKYCLVVIIVHITVVKYVHHVIGHVTGFVYMAPNVRTSVLKNVVNVLRTVL